MLYYSKQSKGYPSGGSNVHSVNSVDAVFNAMLTSSLMVFLIKRDTKSERPPKAPQYVIFANTWDIMMKILHLQVMIAEEEYKRSNTLVPLN